MDDVKTREQKVYDALEAMHIPYERHEHAAAATMKDLEDIDEVLRAKSGAVHCKNLFLANKRGHFLLMLPGGKKFRTAEVSKQIGTSRLSFASDEDLALYLGLEGGAISPMGLLNDAGKHVQLLIDEDLRGADKLIVHPNVNTASIIISGLDFYDVFLPKLGYTPLYVVLSTLLDEA